MRITRGTLYTAPPDVMTHNQTADNVAAEHFLSTAITPPLLPHLLYNIYYPTESGSSILKSQSITPTRYTPPWMVKLQCHKCISWVCYPLSDTMDNLWVPLLPGHGLAESHLPEQSIFFYESPRKPRGYIAKWSEFVLFVCSCFSLFLRFCLFGFLGFF